MKEPLIGYIIGWGLVAVVIWFMIATIIRIHREVGLSSTCGFLWLLAVLVGNLLGVLLYRFFREPTEYLCDTLFGRWSR
jgi:F0F1-type ATP synthase assembly protein I